MASPVLSAQAENDLLEVETEDQEAVFATLARLRHAGEPGVVVDGEDLTMVTASPPAMSGDSLADADASDPAAIVYRIWYKPMTESQAEPYEPSAVFWVLRISPFTPVWSLRDLEV